MKRSGATQCTICRHREHAAIDIALARGVAVRALARRYKPLSIDALYRHSANHLPPQLRAQLIAGPQVDGVDLDRLRETESQSLLANLVALRNRLFSALDVAEENGDSAMVSRVSAQLHRNLEITGELLGDLTTCSTTINSVVVLPAYVEMRVALVSALDPYPDARKAVASVLHRIESKAADSIKANAEQGFAHARG